MQSEDFGLSLELDENEDLTIQQLGYWPGKPSNELISTKAWNKTTRMLKLGSGGLNLTIIKPGGTKNQNITLEKMKNIRKIMQKPDLDKVTLAVKFFGSDEVLDVCPNVILDKSRYLIEASRHQH